MSEIKYMNANQIADDPKYPFTIGMLRFYLLNRENNGLCKAIRRIGSRLFFRSDLFDEWIDKHTYEEK